MSSFDNCSLLANGTGPPALACDTDQDGYGDHCDCDYNNDGKCNTTDFSQLRNEFGPTPGVSTRESDAGCNGTVNTIDFNNFRSGYQGGTGTLVSGLACSGTVPCP
jgi:hypothetical protein